MPLDSRNKGKNGELELAAFLRDHGVTARRGRQYSGGTDSPDIVHSLPGIHLECKRCEKGNVYNWLYQATDDCIDGLVPIVAHRRNRKHWIAILDLDDLLELIKK